MTSFVVAVLAPVLAALSFAASGQEAQKAPDMHLTIGKSTLLRLPEAVGRVSVGNPIIADVTAISPTQLYLLGKDVGTTNIILWSKSGGRATVMDVTVSADVRLLEEHLAKLLPAEKDIKVTMSSESIVLSGSVSDPVAAANAVMLAQAWVRSLSRGLSLPVGTEEAKASSSTTDKDAAAAPSSAADRNIAKTQREPGPPVINMLSVRAPMQVMLEVKVAEVSKRLLSRLGITTRITGSSGSTSIGLLSRSNFLGQLLGSAFAARASGDFVELDAQRDDGLIKLLAEPNIMAVSGQEASFRAGGKVFIPVGRRNDATGGVTITLEEKEFGVGVKFKPTVLAGGLISLRVSPEVSELQQQGTPFTSVDGTTSVLPSMTLRRAETTLQLGDGDSFMIAGLVQHNATATVNRFPGLGDIPILGALFRSSEFNANNTELMFVVTAHLVKPLPDGRPALPTDGYTAPALSDFHLHGQMPKVQR